MLVLKQEDIESSQDRVYRQICEFLRIECADLPEELSRKRINASSNTLNTLMPKDVRVYLCRRWLPMVKRLQSKFGIDVGDWDSSMQETVKDSSLSFGRRIFFDSYAGAYHSLYYTTSLLQRFVRKLKVEATLKRPF